MPEPLSGRQTRYLRGLGHHLEPSVWVGGEGVNDGVHRSAAEALAAHELIKVKLGQNCPGDRRDVAAGLAQQLAAVVVQVLGRTVLLYRPSRQRRLRLP